MRGETWILVADAAAARFFRADRASRRLELVRVVGHDAGRLKASELVADQQGRSLTRAGWADGTRWSRTRTPS